RPRPPAAADRGRRAAGLGDPRVMALFQAICAFTHLPRGFRNRDLRPQVEALLGRSYSTAQMTYDLRRLRLKGLIHRIPKTHRYTATSYGLKVAFFYAKLYLRIFRPNWPALLAEADPFPRPLRAALDSLDREIQKLHDEAALAAKNNLLQPLRSSPLEMSSRLLGRMSGQLVAIQPRHTSRLPTGPTSFHPSGVVLN